MSASVPPAMLHLAAIGGVVETRSRGEARSTMPPDEVARWVTGARRGERAAYAALYARFARPVHAVVLARAPSGDVDDAVQEAFIAAWKNLDSLSDPASFGAWILQIARRTAIDQRRKARPNVELSPESALTHAPPRAEALEVLEKMRTLPEAYQETLVMRLVDGMSGPEIAEATGLTPESVRVNLCRGMKLLREKLGWETKP
jgi:RNA polymerase sigma-70 factor (ECF subfamily)